MKVLLAVDGSDYTRRMISYLGAHQDLWSASHSFTAFYAVLPVPHRAAAFAGPDITHGYYEDDARVVLQPVRAWMAEAGIAATLGLALEQVNVKAKTAEKLGPVGEGRAMEARAVALLHRMQPVSQ